jgi:hypothetical protein
MPAGVDCGLSRAKKRGGAVSRQFLEVVDHVHLIIVAQVVGDLGPGTLRRCQLRSERLIQSNNPRIELRRNPDLFQKLPFELTDGPSRARYKIVDAGRSSADTDLAYG